MLLKELISSGVIILSEIYPEGEAREIVFALLEDMLGTRRHTHIVDPSYVVSDEDSVKVMNAFSRLSSGEPLQYVTGKAYFHGREFKVSSSVLIPRPETELLCRTAIDENGRRNNVRMLDMCTGSGCIAWTMALECPGAEVTAVDLSDDALAVASSQYFDDEMKLSGAVPPSFFKADVLDEKFSDGFSNGFDIILSNPPYVMESEKALMRSNVLDHEPSMALFVSDDDPLVFYRAVAHAASELLTEDGFGIVEINEALGNETAALFTAAGFPTAKVIQDLSGRDRFVLFKRS